MPTQTEDEVATDRQNTTPELPAEEYPTAVKELWYAWAIALLSAAASAYFFTIDDFVSMPAEPFYAVIFAAVAVVSALYGVYEVRKLTTPF